MNLPNKLTMLRICLVPVFIVFFYLQFKLAPVVAVAVFIIAALTDALDGYIARKYNLVTDFGKLMDPIADKILVVCALFLIVESNLLPVALSATCSAIIVSRELLISGVRQIAATKGVVIQANVYGKIKTIVQTIALPIVLLLKLGESVLAQAYQIFYIIGLSMFILATLLTIISGIVYLVQNRKVFL